jgi:PKD repeat protein
LQVPDTICTNETIVLSALGTGAEKYKWDFCSGDLAALPVLTEGSSIEGALTSSGITMVTDQVNWYGFVSSRDNNKLIRLDYGSSLGNTPVIRDLGNPGDILSRPEQMKIIREGNNWIGLVVNLNNFSNNYSVVRLNFGNSLTNMPTATRLSALDSHLSLPRGIEIAEDQGRYSVFIANTGNNSIKIIDFGNSLQNNILASQIKTISLPGASSGHNVMGISLIKSCNEWFGMAVTFSNRMYRLKFNSSLANTPEIELLSTPQILNFSPVKVSLIHESSYYYAIILGIDGKAYQLDFGAQLNNSPTITKSFSRVSDVVAMDVVEANSEFRIFSVDWVSNKVFQFVYPNTCDVNLVGSGNQPIESVSYVLKGFKKITLTAYDANNNISTFTDSVFVRPAILADFTATDLCEGATTRFRAPTAGGGNRAKAWYWELGDGGTSTAENPAHIFATAGSKTIKLTLTDICDRTTTVTKEITIYRNSTPDFIAPAEICSSQPVAFKDASTVVDDAIVSWQWDFGNGDTSTAQEPEYTYAQAGNYHVSLTITGKSGCQLTTAKPVIVKAGAMVDFSVRNACLGNETAFSDLTTFPGGTGFVSRIWDFGDGETSMLANPVYRYTQEGTYVVTLTVQNNIGCAVTRTKTISITLLPKPGFSFSLACSGEATSFFDESTAQQTDIVAWEWNFGDMASGADNTSDKRNPSHVFTNPGTYEVRLKVQTIHGCTDSLARTIQVISSPGGSFTYSLDCASRQVRFSDQSLYTAGNELTSWYWDFGDGNSSQVQNPKHTYKAYGVYTVQLVVTAATRCTSNFTQTVQISGAPVADFTSSGLGCVNNTLTFTDRSVAPAIDPIASWEWDFGRFGTSALAQPSVTFTSAEALTVPVSLTITTAAGCKARITRDIILVAAPAVSITYQPLSNLTPLQIAFAGNVTGEAIEYSWNFGDGEASAQKDPVHTYERSGTYTVQFTAENAQGCMATQEKEITVSTVPDMFELKLEAIEATLVNNMIQLTAFVYNNSPFTIQALDFITLPDGQGKIMSTWEGVLLPGKGMRHTYSIPSINSASICVRVEDAGRKYTSNRQCTSLQDQLIILDPYPNPAKNRIHLPVILPASTSVEVSITDVLGKQYSLISTGLLNNGFNEIPLNVAHLKPGLYYIRCHTGGAIISKKMVIQ